jgi:hypothetical protein
MKTITYGDIRRLSNSDITITDIENDKSHHRIISNRLDDKTIENIKATELSLNQDETPRELISFENPPGQIMGRLKLNSTNRIFSGVGK